MPGPNFAQDFSSQIILAGSVTGASGVAPIAGGASLALRGLPASTGAPGQSVVRTGAGAYEIHLSGTVGDNYQDGSHCELQITSVGAAAAANARAFRMVSWALGVITIQCTDCAAPGAADGDFTFVVERVVP